MRLAAAGVLILLVAAAARTADSPAQLLFNRVRDKILANIERVPRYTCVETVTRVQYRPQYGRMPSACPALIAARSSLPSPGLLLWHDRLRLDVAIGKDSEIFSYAGASSFETGDMAQLALTGATGSGAFGSFLTSIFGHDGDQFRYVGERDVSGVRYAAYEYRVPVGKSHYTFRTGDSGENIVGYRGAFYVIPATAELRRLEVEATEFPTPGLCRVVDTMDYTKVRIGNGDFLLPEVSTMTVLYQNGDEARNETHFSGCREYVGESSIRFDDPDEPNSPAATAKAELRSLPPKTRIRVKIDPPVNTESAAAGDPITGVVEHEVRQKGQAIVRTTDRLHGRILRLEQAMVPQPRWIVAIRFDSIERDGVQQKVTLRPLDDGDRTPQPVRYIGRRMQSAQARELPERPEGAGLFILSGAGNILLDQKFHSEWETR